VTGPADRAPRVVCTDVRSPAEAAALAVDVDRWRRLALDCLGDEGVGGELTLTFVDRDEIADLNLEHMGVDGPTDVLSFPLDDDSPAGVPTLLGDVVVSPAVAAAQAVDHAGSVDDELALLVVHGILHVLGHDHAALTETQRMRARELELLRAHHWGGPAPDGFRQEHPPS
jgi:probable rRNA maturation factor